MVMPVKLTTLNTPSPNNINFINISGLIIDMDGVLWKGTQVLPGFIEFFKKLRKLGMPFILATNNATLTQQQYVDKFKKLGVSVSTKEILTSSMATALYLFEQTQAKSTRIYVIGECGTKEPLLKYGFTLVDDYHAITNKHTKKLSADIVVCGLDRKITWDKLEAATLYIRAGAKFIATNADTTLPTERGTVLGNGSILAALQTATSVRPTVIGKPQPIMYQQAIKLLKTTTKNTVAIGDRLETDILGAVNANIRSIMVLTGISTASDLNLVNFKPTWVMPNLADITTALCTTN